MIPSVLRGSIDPGGTLDGKVVAITGASAGVGRAAAHEFAKHGASVGLLARDPDRLETTRQEIEMAGGRAAVAPVDVADAAAVEAAAARVENELGPIDIWVNDAMATIFARTWDVKPEEIKRATEVIYLGTVHGTMAALRRFRERGSGTIVQVGSALAYRAIPLQAAYCAGKFAIRGFTDSLRVELMNDDADISVTMVQLPGLNTPQFSWVRVRGLSKVPRPVAPVFSPDVAARGIVFAATHRRREVWVGGSTWLTIIGNTLAPSLADRYLARTNPEGQQSETPIERSHGDYLFDPVDRPYSTHGPYEDEEKSRSIQFSLSRWRLPLAAGAAGAALGAIAGLARACRS